MELIDLPIERVHAPDWNPNQMAPDMRARLAASIQRFGLVVPLVVRSAGNGEYETVGGALRLLVLIELGYRSVPCVVVEADDAEARLLAQALNHIAGEDDPGLRAEALRVILTALPREDVLAVLPETAESLSGLASLGQQDVAEHLRAWQQAQAARLKHLMFQLTPSQLETVSAALERAAREFGGGGDGGNPNRRGLVLYHLCRAYLEREVSR